MTAEVSPSTAAGPSGPLTVKVWYKGTPSSTNIYYTSTDLSGNVIQARTPLGITELPTQPGIYTFDQVVTLDQFITIWDENDGNPGTVSVIATRHPVTVPAAPTAVTAVGGDTQATISFTPSDNGGSAILYYTVTAIDNTNAGRGGQTQTGTASPIIIPGLTNGDNYTFTVQAHTAIGDSPNSAFSNSVTPAVVLHVPGAPTGVSAAVSGSGQVSVSFTPPVNNGGAAITGYTVTAVDETTVAHGGQTSTGASSPRTVSALFNGEAYHFTVHATNSVGDGPESVVSNTVTPSGSGGTPTFIAVPQGGTWVLLDATGSIGTLAWEIDGVATGTTTTTLLIGPLKVGTHHVKLTAVSGGANVSERDIDVAWVARPLGKAQNDPINGSGSTGVWGVPFGTYSSTLLPKWADLALIYPWHNHGTLNMVEGYPGAGDGVERLHIFDTNHISLLTKRGDRPGSSGGYRSGMEMNDAYMQNQSYSSGTTYASGTKVLSGGSIYTSLQNSNLNHTPASSPTWWSVYSEFAESHSLDVCGQNIDNSGVVNGNSTEVRFYRCSFLFPTGTANPLLYMNNAYELFGVSDGAIYFSTNGAGTQVGWTARSKVLGSSGPNNQFDFANILINVWYDYVIEVCFNTSATVGYIRVYRDQGTGAGMQLISLSRCPAGTKGKSPDTTPSSSPDYGKFFYATAQTFSSGVVAKVAIELENYRDRTGLDANPGAPDSTIEYKNCIVGPTLPSVMI